jgi:hypothetical protein
VSIGEKTIESIWNYTIWYIGIICIIYQKLDAQFLLRNGNGFMKVCLDELQLFLLPKKDGLNIQCKLQTIYAKSNE